MHAIIHVRAIYIYTCCTVFNRTPFSRYIFPKNQNIPLKLYKKRMISEKNINLHFVFITFLKNTRRLHGKINSFLFKRFPSSEYKV